MDTSDDWYKLKLNQYAEFLQGLTYKPSDVVSEGKIVLRSSNIQNSQLSFDDNVYVDMAIPSRISTKEFDVLMCVRNGSQRLVGKTALIPKQYEGLAWGAFMNIIRPKEQNTYLYHYLNSEQFRQQIQADFNTATVNQITIGTLNGCYITIPKQKSSREKIASFLDLIEQRIHTQSKIIEDLLALKKWIINQCYTVNPLTIKEKLAEYIIQVSARNKTESVTDVLSVSNKNGFVRQNEQFEDREVASEDKSNYKIVLRNDFAYNPARINVGSIARLNTFDVGIVSPMYVCFRTNQRVLPEYLEYYFESFSFNSEMKKRLEGSVRQCLSYEALSEIKIFIPHLDEQKQVIKKLNSVENKIELEKQILINYQYQKKYLLSNMFI